MSLYLTRDVRKDVDYVNGMQAIVEHYDVGTGGLRVVTKTGHRVVVTPWTDRDLGNVTYYPIRSGYASTVMKFQGAELEHATLYMGCPGIKGGAYTAASRVRSGRNFLIGGPIAAEYVTPAQV